MNVAITVDRTSSGKEHFEVLDGLRGTGGLSDRALSRMQLPIWL
jgi:hypothetical protein